LAATLIGVPFGAFMAVWLVGALVDSDAVLLGMLGLVLVGAAVVVWHLPRIRDKQPAARLTWALVGAGIGAGTTVAWIAAAIFVMLQLICGGSGCELMGAD
jgi:hypothetical protein